MSQRPVERANGDHFHVQVAHLKLGEAVLARHLLHSGGHVRGHLDVAVVVDGGLVVERSAHHDLPQVGHDVDAVLDEVLQEKFITNLKILSALDSKTHLPVRLVTVALN